MRSTAAAWLTSKMRPNSNAQTSVSTAEYARLLPIHVSFGNDAPFLEVVMMGCLSLERNGTAASHPGGVVSSTFR